MDTQESVRLSCADTAKLIRKRLKAEFPEIKFSVRSSVYSGGASIDISYTDGVLYSEVNKIAKQYEGATFDGMNDLKEYHTSLVYFDGDDLPRSVRFGADFVFVRRDLSDSFIEKLKPLAQKVLDNNLQSAGEVFDMDKRYGSFESDYFHTDFGFIMACKVLYGSQIVRFLGEHIAEGSI